MPPQVSKFLAEGTYIGQYMPVSDRRVVMVPIKMDGDVEVCGSPIIITDHWARLWLRSMLQAEENYMEGVSPDTDLVHAEQAKPLMAPELARDMLTHAVKADIVWTANMREWRHILNLRAIGTTGAPHPYMQQIMLKMLDTAKAQFPVFFEDL